MSKSMKVASAAMVAGGAPAGRAALASQRLRSVGGCGALALAVGLLVGSPTPALSQVPGPADGHVWAGCVLSEEAVMELTSSITASDLGGVLNDDGLEIAFVVVYAIGERVTDPETETETLTHDNDGQPLVVEGDTTGPVICLNVAAGLGIAPTSQTDDLPATGEGDTVDTLDAEDVFILRYLINSEDEDVDGTIEKVICHTVNDQVDCFRISPLVVPEEVGETP